MVNEDVQNTRHVLFVLCFKSDGGVLPLQLTSSIGAAIMLCRFRTGPNSGFIFYILISRFHIFLIQIQFSQSLLSSIPEYLMPKF